MRLGKLSLIMIALVAPVTGLSLSLAAQTQPAPQAPQPAKAAKQSAKAAAAAQQPAKGAKQAAKAASAGQQSAKTAKQPAKAAAAAAQQPAKAAPAAEKPPQKPAKNKKASQPSKPAPSSAPTHIARRDPFNPLVGRPQGGNTPTERLPPGKAGLVVSTLRVDGIVRTPKEMLAVVSNPQQRVYFLREGDQLFDGKVERITLEAVSFHETGKDAFGKPVERQVIKRLYPSSGEQQ